jgi:predicted RNase H-like HicB family nuclease
MSVPNQSQKFTVIVKENQQGGYTVQCLEVPVTCHGKTKEEAMKNVKEAIESLGWKLTQNY